MTFVESAQLGATANSRSAQKNPLDVLRKLRDADRTGSASKVLERWKKEIVGDDDLLDAALVYAGTNYWHRLEDDERRERMLTQQRKGREQSKAQQQQKTLELTQQIRQIVLLDLELPNGKKLRDATFADCKKAGGWFLRVSKKGRPQQIVGVALTEEQLRAIK